MAAKDDYLLDQLVDLGFVTRPQVDALQVEADAAGAGVVDMLVERKLVRPQDLTTAKASHFGFEVVSVTTEPAFAFGNAAPLPARIGLGPPGTRTNYDITSVGGILGVITAGHTEFVRGSEDQIIIHLNWFADLKARVPHR